MIRSVLIGSLVLGVVASVAGCKVSVETKTRYTENNIVRSDDKDWVGQPIRINIATPGAISQGGLNVTTSTNPAVTKIAANARVLAMAFDTDKPDAQLSIDDVKNRFAITHTDAQITVDCPHGDSHGGSNSGESGCELINIEVPQGTDLTKLDIEFYTANGDVKFDGTTGKFKHLAGNSKNGDITVTLGPVTSYTGADMSFVALDGDAVTLDVQPDFAADKVWIVTGAGNVNTSAFPALTATDNTVGIGAVGTGLRSLKLTSQEFAGTTDTVTIQ